MAFSSFEKWKNQILHAVIAHKSLAIINSIKAGKLELLNLTYGYTRLVTQKVKVGTISKHSSVKYGWSDVENLSLCVEFKQTHETKEVDITDIGGTPKMMCKVNIKLTWTSKTWPGYTTLINC